MYTLSKFCWVAVKILSEAGKEEHFDIQDRKEIKIQSFLMIKILKIKENKETWNQASVVQVRGGLLGYEDQSTAGKIKVLLCQSTAQ